MTELTRKEAEDLSKNKWGYHVLRHQVFEAIYKRALMKEKKVYLNIHAEVKGDDFLELAGVLHGLGYVVRHKDVYDSSLPTRLYISWTE